jgi:hypothetical protein
MPLQISIETSLVTTSEHLQGREQDATDQARISLTSLSSILARQ